MSLFIFYIHRVDCLHIQKSILAQFYLISIANLKVISWSRSSKPAACGKLITILVFCILKQNYLILDISWQSAQYLLISGDSANI